jgi:ABC-type antimicrobial peptide transport system permease subunit
MRISGKIILALAGLAIAALVGLAALICLVFSLGLGLDIHIHDAHISPATVGLVFSSILFTAVAALVVAYKRMRRNNRKQVPS